MIFFSKAPSPLDLEGEGMESFSDKLKKEKEIYIKHLVNNRLHTQNLFRTIKEFKKRPSFEIKGRGIISYV